MFSYVLSFYKDLLGIVLWACEYWWKNCKQVSDPRSFLESEGLVSVWPVFRLCLVAAKECAFSSGRLTERISRKHWCPGEKWAVWLEKCGGKGKGRSFKEEVTNNANRGREVEDAGYFWSVGTGTHDRQALYHLARLQPEERIYSPVVLMAITIEGAASVEPWVLQP